MSEDGNNRGTTSVCRVKTTSTDTGSNLNKQIKSVYPPAVTGSPGIAYCNFGMRLSECIRHNALTLPRTVRQFSET